MKLFFSITTLQLHLLNAFAILIFYEAKSKQLHALSNHLEKMMALLRAEAAAKASAEEALRSTEDELDVVRQEKLMLTAQVGSYKSSTFKIEKIEFSVF